MLHLLKEKRKETSMHHDLTRSNQFTFDYTYCPNVWKNMITYFISKRISIYDFWYEALLQYITSSEIQFHSRIQWYNVIDHKAIPGHWHPTVIFLSLYILSLHHFSYNDIGNAFFRAKGPASQISDIQKSVLS